MKKVIITAANCFIGRRLCRTLSESGFFVYAVVREKFENQELFDGIDNIKIVYCNMENYGKLSSQIEEKCDVGITLAWNGTRGADRSDCEKQSDNFFFSCKAIECFDELGCKVIMTAGSQAEVGPWNKIEKVNETDICNPNTEYGKAKLRLFDFCSEFCERKGIRFIEPRFFSLYGEDDYEKTLIISMVRNMLGNCPCELTECLQLWDFLYVDDAVEALALLIENEDAHGVFNVGYGISKPLKEYVEEMYRITNSKSVLRYGAIPYPATGVVHTNPDVTKLMKTVNWRPRVSFTEGIGKVIALQDNI